MKDNESNSKRGDTAKNVQYYKYIGYIVLALSIFIFFILGFLYVNNSIPKEFCGHCHNSFSEILLLFFFLLFDFALLALSIYLLTLYSHYINGLMKDKTKANSDEVAYQRSIVTRKINLDYDIIRQVLSELSKSLKKDDEIEKQRIIMTYKEDIASKVDDIRKLLEVFSPITTPQKKSNE